MPFSQRPFRPKPSPRIDRAVLAVGRRVYVACPSDMFTGATLTNEAGTSPLASLADGTEVDILAWRPRGSSGTRYRVRSARDGLEGWLPAGNLRASLSPVAPTDASAKPPGTPSPSVESGLDSGRRFGQRAR